MRLSPLRPLLNCDQTGLQAHSHHAPGAVTADVRQWRRAEMAAARRGGRFLGNSRRQGGLARPSIAATPRSRRLSEQVPPRRLRELVPLDVKGFG